MTVRQDERLVEVCSKHYENKELQLKRVKQLLDAGADPSYDDSASLSYAINCRNLNLIEPLLKGGANPNDFGKLYHGEEVSIFLNACLLMLPREYLLLMLEFGANPAKHNRFSDAISCMSLANYRVSPPVWPRNSKEREFLDKKILKEREDYEKRVEDITKSLILKGASTKFVNFFGEKSIEKVLFNSSAGVYRALNFFPHDELKNLELKIIEKWETLKKEIDNLHLCQVKVGRREFVCFAFCIDSIFSPLTSLPKFKDDQERWCIEFDSKMGIYPWELDKQNTTVLIRLKEEKFAHYKICNYVFAEGIPPNLNYFWIQPTDYEVFESEKKRFRDLASGLIRFIDNPL